MSIETIIRQQIEGGKKLTKLAKELGLSRTHLSFILDGKRRAGGKVIRALIAHSDTRDATLSFLSGNVTSITTE